MTLDDALDQLVHRPTVLRAFVQGDDEPVALSPDDRRALATVDRDQLGRTARAVRNRLIHRRHRGSGGIATLFPETVARWRDAHPDDRGLNALAAQFMQSPAFESYRELPFAGPGSCLEECFYRFCEAGEIGDPVARQQEFLAAMVRALAVSPRPAFVVPAEIRRGSECWYAVSTRGVPNLYVARVDGIVIGEITPMLRDLLEADADPHEVRKAHRVGRSVVVRASAGLRALGVLQ